MQTQTFPEKDSSGIPLLADERILWSGKPAQGFELQLFDVPFLLFELLTVGGLVVQIQAQGISTWIFQYLTCLCCPFVPLIILRVLLERYVRGQTYYAVTNKRVLVLGGLSSGRASIKLNDLPEMRLQARDDGRGRIIFGDPDPNFSKFGSSVWSVSDGGGSRLKVCKMPAWCIHRFYRRKRN